MRHLAKHGGGDRCPLLRWGQGELLPLLVSPPAFSRAGHRSYPSDAGDISVDEQCPVIVDSSDTEATRADSLDLPWEENGTAKKPRFEHGSGSAATPMATAAASQAEAAPGRRWGASPADALLFRLTRVPTLRGTGYNNYYSVGLRDILTLPGTLLESVQFNYMFHLPWLLQQYPRRLQHLPLTFVHGNKPGAVVGFGDLPAPPNLLEFKAPNIPSFGTHHSKVGAWGLLT